MQRRMVNEMANSNVNVLQTVIQLRRGTEEQWNLVKDTFIPREGEPCTTIYDDGRDALIKIGDGKHTWGQLGYTRDSFFATVSYSESGKITSDKTYEEVLKAVKQNKYVGVKIRGENIGLEGQDYLLPFAATFELEGSTMVLFGLNGMSCIFFPNGDVHCDKMDYMATSDMLNYNFDAEDKSILNLADSDELTSAVTRGYTDNSTPTFIFLEEQDGAIKSKVTDLNTLKTALMSQTNGYTQTSNPLYKAIKCYAVLDGNCYDLVYSSQENANIVKRTFYAITTDGLNKLNVVIDENQTDENQKVVWTKEAQGVASEQFIVTVQDVGGVDKSDKTPAEIKAAMEAGKQVILQRTYEGKIQTAYLVSIMDERADFCFLGISTDIDYIPPNSDTFIQEWVTITADKAVKIHREMRTDMLVIQREGTNWTSIVSPRDFFMAGSFGPSSNVCLNLDSDGGQLSGVIAGSFNSLHVYFPDYTNSKVYDFKWNEDEENTYTLTELNLGAEGPMIVNFTITNPQTLQCTADKTFAEVDAAYKKGIPIYGRVALNHQQGFLSCSHEKGGSYNFTGLAMKSNFAMAINYTSTDCGAFLAKIMWKDFVDNNATWDASEAQIENVGSPTKPSDAATKQYADNILTAGNSDSVVIKSSTPNSTKKFRITVDDAGAISATEVT